MPRGRFNMTLFLNCISKKVYDMENLKLISDFIKLRVLLSKKDFREVMDNSLTISCNSPI